MTPEEIKKHNAEMATALSAAREATVEVKEIALTGKSDASEAKQIAERANTALDELEKKNAEVVNSIGLERKNSAEMAEKIKAMETKISKLKSSTGYVGSEVKRREELDREMRSLDIYSSNPNDNSMEVLEKKGIEKKYFRSDSNPDGGFLMEESYDDKIIKKLEEVSPIRALARTKTIQGIGENLLAEAENVQGYWTAEGQTFTESNFQFEAPRIPLHSMTVLTESTTKALIGSRFNFDNMVGDGFRRTRVKVEGYAFVLGDGVDKPTGLLDSKSGITSRTSTVAGAFDFADLTLLTGDVKTGYQCQYGMNGRTLAFTRTLTDTNGHYIFAPGNLGAKIPNMINGVPYVEIPDMPDNANNALSVIYGDFYEGYEVIDSSQAFFLRNPWIKQGKTVFSLEAFVGGQTIQKEAFKLLKCLSS